MKNKTNSAVRKILCGVSLLAMTFLTTVKTNAADGDLDLTFDAGGKVTTDFNSPNDFGRAVAVQLDGKIIVAGEVLQSSGNFDFALVRYNADGSLDASFDGDGKLTTDFNNRNDSVYAVVIQTDGKIVVAGESAQSSNFAFDFALARYNVNGSLDTSFDGDGKLTTDFGSEVDRAVAVALQPDGKIVAVGTATINDSNFALARYNPDGSLDTTFDTDGRVTTRFTGANERANGVAIQADGRIVATGFMRQDIGNHNFALARYNSNGSLDTTFDGDGKVTTDFNGFIDEAQDIALQSDGRIVVAGFAHTGAINNTQDFALARYNPNGLLDASFDGDGKVTAAFGSLPDLASALLLQSDGKLIAVGTTGGSIADFALARYNVNGSLDTSFSGDGKVTTNFQFSDEANAAALQPDGKILVAGSTFAAGGGSGDFAVARYENSAAAASRARPFDFDGDGKSDISVFRPISGNWFVQRSTGGFSGVPFGLASDKLVPADFDGDGKTDIAVYRSGVWYILQSLNNQVRSVTFGASEDNPRPADFDGDGRADVAVFRPSIGVWFILQSSNNQPRGVQFGQLGDVPMIADFDADGKSDITVFRPSNGTWFYLRSSDNGFRFAAFGQTGDVPLSGDFNGDGASDLAVFRPSNGFWYVARPTGVPAQNFESTQFGVSTDVPTPADYDGDGRTDIAVFRNGTWFVLRSSQGFTGAAFGAADDKPIPAAFQ